MIKLPNGSIHYWPITSNVRKKIREPLNVTKVQSNVMLVLTNVTMKPLDVRKKKRETPNVTKE